MRRILTLTLEQRREVRRKVAGEVKSQKKDQPEQPTDETPGGSQPPGVSSPQVRQMD